MSPPDTNSEPSIEEILDSIRQIISDDEGGEESAPLPPVPQAVEAAPAPKPAAAAPAPKAATMAQSQGDDVLELTERVPSAPKAAPAKQPIEIDMQDPDPLPAPSYTPPPARAKAPEPAMNTPPMDDLESVITQKAEAAAMKAFSELSQKASIEKGGGVTIEDVVRYEVRPLLRAWIDKYLPGIVERLLQKELEKISKRFDQD